MLLVQTHMLTRWNYSTLYVLRVNLIKPHTGWLRQFRDSYININELLWLIASFWYPFFSLPFSVVLLPSPKQDNINTYTGVTTTGAEAQPLSNEGLIYEPLKDHDPCGQKTPKQHNALWRNDFVPKVNYTEIHLTMSFMSSSRSKTIKAAKCQCLFS